MQVTPEELLEHAAVTSDAIVSAVGTGFDVVLSACVLSQMQFMLVNVMTDRHPLFEAVRHTLNLTHLRTLLRLQAPGGRGVLATDVSSDGIAPFGASAQAADLKPLLNELVAKGSIFYAADPRLLQTIASDDPELSSRAKLTGPLDVWLWQNGPRRLFLVYALELSRLGE
jgi:hypothetical protein